MVNAVFRGAVSYGLSTAITGYAFLQGTWNFRLGNPWPIMTREFYNGVQLQATGILVDVFDMHNNVARVTSFSFGNTGGIGTSGSSPGWWNDRITGINGGSYGASSGFTRFQSYSIGARRGAGIVDPQWPQTTIKADNVSLVDWAWAANAPVNAVNMPVLGRAACFINQTALRVDILADDGTLQLGVQGNPGSNNYFGTIPGTNYYVYNGLAGGTQMGLALLAGGLLTAVPIVWDNATVNATLQSTASGLYLARATLAGWLLWYPIPTLPTFTIDGIVYGAPGVFVLTKYDGTEYRIVVPVGLDAAARAALLGNQTATGHLTPDGVLWFQANQVDASKVFTGLPLGKYQLPIFPPVPLPDNMPDAFENLGRTRIDTP